MRSSWLWVTLAIGLGMVGAAACDGGTPNSAQSTGSGGQGGAGGDTTSSGGGRGGSGGSGGQACMPAQEICGNGVDEDCNGAADEPETCVLMEGDAGSLVVRYHIDEAEDNATQPPELLDAAPDPLPLSINYGVDEVYFATDGTSRALEWPNAGTGGLAAAALDGTKVLTALNGRSTVTIEAVVDILDVGADPAPIVWFGTNFEEGQLALRADDIQRVALVKNNLVVGRWNVNLAVGRSVVHAVIDTTQATPEDTVKLYVDGEELTESGGAPPAMGDTISLEATASLVLGNIRLPQGASPFQSFQGRLYYAAVYGSALTPEQIVNNVTVLRYRDDTPAAQ